MFHHVEIREKEEEIKPWYDASLVAKYFALNLNTSLLFPLVNLQIWGDSLE